MFPKMPTVEQVRQLPSLLTMTIPPEWQDLNGHVNVQHYLGIYDRTGLALMEMLGIDESRFLVEKVGFFDLEHHIWYLNEMHVRDEVSAHTRFIAQSPKRFHGVMFVVNNTRGSLASAIEFVTTGADLTSRRTAALSDDIAARVRRQIEGHATLDWPAPQCGSIAP